MAARTPVGSAAPNDVTACSPAMKPGASPPISPTCRSYSGGRNRLNVRARKTLPLLIQLRTNRFTGNIDVMGQQQTHAL